VNPIFGPLSRRLAVVAVVAFALAGGIAYAAIPDTGTAVYHACMFRNFGTIRLIDPERQHCSAVFETEITFNQKGVKGDQGIQGAVGPVGAAGSNGSNGVSPTVTPVSVGDSHCLAGGAAITDATGSTAYVCSGQNGANGTDGQAVLGHVHEPEPRFLAHCRG